jgi:murein DD-endopeptidase MepM/ murein hydrolase activator NlpD
MEHQNPTPSKKSQGEKLVRIGVSLLAVALVAFLVVTILRQMETGQIATATGKEADEPAESSQDVQDDPASLAGISLSPLETPIAFSDFGITRRVSLDTIIPNRPRTEVITYTVKAGDNLFDIAESYGLKPETMFFGNYDTLKDDPHIIQPGLVLNILPEDGAYYKWNEGDDLNGVAASYNVTATVILEYPGNNLDLTATAADNWGILPGTWLIIPGGTRPIKDWGPPAISRSNPASASYLGPGHCGEIYQGPIGTGGFTWPTTEHFLSGYHYSSIHRGVDIGGSMGNAIYAADSGVVVYAGWSNWGYGNLIVIDHGNGWQTAYAHLDTFNVGCGQGVGIGMYIGGMGSTGNSSGPHLHFEMIYNGTKPNPMDYVQ